MTIKQSNYIKLIAMVTMFIDHAGIILFPNIILLRIIGRISFPLFAYQLGVGYEHTKNVKKYILRLFLFGALLQFIYSVSIYIFKMKDSCLDLNIFFTLSLGLLAIHLYSKKSYYLLLLALILPLATGYFKINFDYGLFGTLLILIFYMKRKNLIQLIICLAILSAAYDFLIKNDNNIEIFSLLSVLFLVKPKSLRFNIPRYVFYIFYPLHLAFLYTIEMVLK